MRRYGIIVFVLGICLLVAGVLSLSWGQMKIPFLHVVAGLAQGMELPILAQVPVPADEMAVIWHIRLPRTIVGLLTGAGLGISGAVLQGIFANQLAAVLQWGPCWRLPRGQLGLRCLPCRWERLWVLWPPWGLRWRWLGVMEGFPS